MKVTFKATPEDFADIAKRSGRANASVWNGIMIYALIFGGICAVIGQLVFEHWIGAVASFFVGAAIVIGLTRNSSNRSLARYYKGLYEVTWPIDVEVETSKDGISLRQLDH